MGVKWSVADNMDSLADEEEPVEGEWQDEWMEVEEEGRGVESMEFGDCTLRIDDEKCYGEGFICHMIAHA